MSICNIHLVTTVVEKEQYDGIAKILKKTRKKYFVPYDNSFLFDVRNRSQLVDEFRFSFFYFSN
jgi:hypothetical protein